MPAALSRAVPLVAALAAAVPPPAPPAQPGQRVLARGAHGDDVRALEDVLGELDLPTDTDGVFDAGTAARVKAYERREDLPVDGAVSPGQWRGMRKRADEPAPGMRPAGSPGGDTPLPGATPDRPAPRDRRTYPVDGPHHYGEGFGDRGGAHQGEDVLAHCGTPLRAIDDATVRRVATQAAAGRYVVLHDAHSGEDYVYMHLSTVGVAPGDRVTGGEKIGEVGRTGDATACHLHVEEWTAPGWYAGGEAKDPLPLLRSLAAS